MGCTTSAIGVGACDLASAATEDSRLCGQASTPASTARAILSARVGVIAGSAQRLPAPPVQLQGRAHRLQRCVSQETDRRGFWDIPTASTFNSAFRYRPTPGSHRVFAGDPQSQVATDLEDRQRPLLRRSKSKYAKGPSQGRSKDSDLPSTRKLVTFFRRRRVRPDSSRRLRTLAALSRRPLRHPRRCLHLRRHRRCPGLRTAKARPPSLAG
jgi:hypothetical protein